MVYSWISMLGEMRIMVFKGFLMNQLKYDRDNKSLFLENFRIEQNLTQKLELNRSLMEIEILAGRRVRRPTNFSLKSNYIID